MKSATYRLPFPVSVNEMYANASPRSGGRGRIKTAEYRTWIGAAGLLLNTQRPIKFTTRVDISIDLDERRQGDCANREKGVTDLLVDHGIILDDSKRYVRRVSIGWEPCDECLVHINEVP